MNRKMHLLKFIARFLKLLLAFSAFSVSPGGCTSSACEVLRDGSSLSVHWWNIKPYIYKSPQLNEIAGAFYDLLLALNHSVNLNFSETSYKTYHQLWKASKEAEENQSVTNAVYLPVMIKKTSNNLCKVKLFQSDGPAFIVRKNIDEPLKQLGQAMINGAQLIGLVLLLTAISGIFMWALDRSSNPEDFPPSFIRGSWQGFWWAFVTMTTVGYGDTAPRSVPARVYSIFWMLLGMVAFSILTANITSSLTHKLETDLNLFGKRIAVLNNSLAYDVALSHGAKSEEFVDIDTMAQNLQDKNVEGMLLDRHIAVAVEDLEKRNLVVGTLLDWSYYYGMQLHVPNGSCEAIGKCLESIVKMDSFAKMTGLRDSVHIMKSSPSESASMFDDYRFFLILLALFGSLVGVGLLWSYFVYSPRMANSNETLESIQTDKTSSSTVSKIILFKTDLENMCDGCKTTIKNIAEKEGKERLEELSRELSADFSSTLAGISSQFNAIPGVSSIKKLGGGLPTNVQSLRKLNRIIHASSATQNLKKSSRARRKNAGTVQEISADVGSKNNLI